MTDTTASLGIEVKTSGVKEASQDLDRLDASAKKVAQSTQQLNTGATAAAFRDMDAAAGRAATAQTELAQKATATSKAMDFLRGIFGGASDEISRARAVHSLYAAVGKTTEAVTKTASATGVFRDAMHTLNPVLASAGGNLGAFGGLLGAARAGATGLALAIGGTLLASLERANEATQSLRKQLTALSPGGGAQFEQLQETARNSGASLSALASITQTFDRAIENSRTDKWIGDLAAIGRESSGAATALANLSKAAGADLGAVDQALKGVLQDGRLTVQTFDAITNANSAVALSIARAFGQTSIATFRANLAATPATVDQLVRALNNYGPVALQAANDTRSISASFGVLRQGINDVAAALDQKLLPSIISTFGSLLSWIGRAIPAIGEMNRAINSMTFGRRGTGATGAGGPSFRNSSGQDIFQSGSLNGPSFGLPSSGGGNGSGGVAGFDVARPGGGQGDYSLYTDYYGGGSGSYNPYGYDPYSFAGDYASGGSFVVGGSGGTDTTAVWMRATPGERVTVEPPGMQSSRSRIGGRGLTINVNVSGVASPAAFIPAAAQIKRALSRQFR